MRSAKKQAGRAPRGPRVHRVNVSFSQRRKRVRRATIAGLGIALMLAAGTGPAQPTWSRCAAASAREIFSGIVYGCEMVPAGPEGRGIVHWVRIDLAAPGIELYVTPLDASAVAQGWQYRLRSIEDVVLQEQLAVAVNGTLFTSASPWKLKFAGDLARALKRRCPITS